MIRAAFIFLALAAAAHAAVDVDRMVAVLREKEEWNGHDGAAGERGPWQITRAVWRLHMPGVPFTEARKAAQARVCALRHVRYLSAELEARGVPATAWNIALVWNAGLGGATRGQAPVRAYHYANEVAALYDR